MFKNWHTSTKLFILCGLFIISLSVATYFVILETRISIDFAAKELIGNRYLGALRRTYSAVLLQNLDIGALNPPAYVAIEILRDLSSAEAAAAKTLHTAENERALAVALTALWSNEAGQDSDKLSLDALGKTEILAKRIGDDSNLTLDPDLDTYYLQDVVVTKLPIFLRQFGELRTLLRLGAATDPSSSERGVRLLVVDALIRSTIEGMETNLATAYSGPHWRGVENLRQGSTRGGPRRCRAV